jgi:hypothetical protein
VKAGTNGEIPNLPGRPQETLLTNPANDRDS